MGSLAIVHILLRMRAAPVAGTRITAAALVAAISLASAGQLVAEEEELWQALLREQLVSQFDCKLNYATNVRKFELGGEQMLEARAHCYDKRTFDVWWRPEEQRFEIRACKPEVC
jgi:hypothetical protein